MFMYSWVNIFRIIPDFWILSQTFHRQSASEKVSLKMLDYEDIIASLIYFQYVLNECSFHMKFIKQAFGEFNKIKYEMIMSVRFCLSNDFLNGILSHSKFVYFNVKLYCCHGCPYGVTCCRWKCHETCGHNIIYVMTTVTSYDKLKLILLFSNHLACFKFGISKAQDFENFELSPMYKTKAGFLMTCILLNEAGL